MIKLYIENQLVELGENFSVPLTKTFENLENPTQIINTYSKTVTIPHTQKNDRLFGFLFNPDRLTAKESDTLTGIYFDPYQKISIRLEYNDSILLTGYLKVLSVDSKGYNCSLNGELGKVFQELQKITFDETKYEGEEKDKYWIDGSQYVKEKITKGLVKYCWDSNGQTSLKLIKRGEMGYRVSDIIGFTPNTSYNKDFTYSNVWTKSDFKMHSFEDILKARKWDDTTTWEDKVGVTANSVVGDGIKPMAYQNFVSYHQNPFIWWNKFWNIFREKAEITTGYEWDMDGVFFNTSNPFWSKSAIELMNRDEFAESKFTNLGNLQFGPYTSKNYDDATVSKDGIIMNITDGTINKTILNPSGLFLMQINNDLSIHYRVQIEENVGAEFNINTVGAIRLLFTFLDENNNKVTRNIIALNKEYYKNNAEFNAFLAKYDVKVLVENSTAIDKGNMYYEGNIIIPMNIQFIFDTPVKYDSLTILKYSFATGDNDYIIQNMNHSIWRIDVGGIKLNRWVIDMSSYNQVLYNRFRSGDKFTLNTLCNLDFTAILNYCKQFRIIVIVDDINKKLRFISHNQYFKNYTVSKWDNKLDKTKDFTITPITWEKKYILFAYKDHPSELGETYKNSNGFTYGEKKIITRYNFNEETEELFKSWYSPLLFSPTYNYWNELYNDFSAYPYVYANKFLCCEDKDGKYKAISGTWFIPTFTNIDCPDRDTVIADDTNQMIVANSYCYTDIDTVAITRWCTPEVKFEDRLFLFNKPNTSYVYKNDYYDNCSGLYDLFWANYIAERYNTQNKIVTCYLKLTPSDYANFEFNHFITIENQLYMVNKIYDYDITSTDSTKVDLITIQNIEGYTTNNFN